MTEASESMEADLCRLLHPTSGYAHAENILIMIERLERRLPHSEAIAQVHAQIFEGGNDGTALPLVW